MSGGPNSTPNKMPELPEVEAVRLALVESGIVESRITGVTLNYAKAVLKPSAAEFVDRVRGRVVLDAARRAKYLYFPLDEGALVVHLRMTGNLKIEAPAEPVERVPTAVFSLSTGREMRFYDRRRLGKLWLVDDVETLFACLGPEPLGPEFTADWLKDRLSSRNAPIKPLLMEQDIAAGVSNIYADEALFCARIHPSRSASKLTDEEVGRLHACIVDILQRAVGVLAPLISGGASPTLSETGHEALRVPRRVDQPCSNCSTPVKRLVIRGRSAYFCGVCQG